MLYLSIFAGVILLCTRWAHVIQFYLIIFNKLRNELRKLHLVSLMYLIMLTMMMTTTIVMIIMMIIMTMTTTMMIVICFNERWVCYDWLEWKVHGCELFLLLQVIDDLRGHVVSCIDGQSFNVIAYGETGSGKTFTIQVSPQ